MPSRGAVECISGPGRKEDGPSSVWKIDYVLGVNNANAGAGRICRIAVVELGAWCQWRANGIFRAPGTRRSWLCVPVQPSGMAWETHLIS
jgi:hypothetical protein